MEFKRKEEIIAALIGEPTTKAMQQERRIAERAPGFTEEIAREAEDLDNLAALLRPSDDEPDPFTERALHSRIFTRLGEKEEAPKPSKSGAAIAAVLATAMLIVVVVLAANPHVEYNRTGQTASVSFEYTPLSYQLELLQSSSKFETQEDNYYDYEKTIANIDAQDAEVLIGVYSPNYFYANLSGAGYDSDIYDLPNTDEQG